MCDFLLFDISNILYRTFFANTNEDSETIAGLAMHSGLVTLNKYFRQHKPRKKVIMAFDSFSWRKEYTASALCISKVPYKGNRRKDMSPSQQAKYEQFIGHLRSFEKMIAEHTNIVFLRGEKLEADDLLAGFVQMHQNDEIVIISSDTDLLQLQRYGNVVQISPDGDKKLTLEKFDNDPQYYLFTKCLRGDSTDNVMSAYPRVRQTRIAKAYKDPFEQLQLMKERWTDHNGTEFYVEELFEENQLLIDLEQQPEPIRKRIKETIEQALVAKPRFSLFFLMKFITKYELNKIKDNIDSYLPMLSK